MARSLKFTFGILAALFSAPSFAAPLPTLRFDMGTESSPVAQGFKRVAPGTKYDAASGFGWTSEGQAAFDVEKPADDPEWHQSRSLPIPQGYLAHKEHNDLTRDGVASRADLVFHADLPNGEYRIAVALGRLDRPINSENISVNGKPIAQNVSAMHYADRKNADIRLGYPKTVRANVTVKDGSIEVRIHGDDAPFKARFAAEWDKPSLTSYLRPGDPIRVDKPEKRETTADWGKSWLWVWDDIGGPFTENAVMSIEIYPFVRPPLWLADAKLAATSEDPHLRGGADLFNKREFAAAEKEFDEVKDDYARSLGWLWLAGRPQYEEEERLLPKALQILEKIAPARADDRMFGEMLENARRLDKAIYRFNHRADEGRTYVELLLISGEVESMQPEDPLYYKGLIYAGRGMYMIIPHRWTYIAMAGRQRFEWLEKAGFGDNRFVKWYLHDSWEPNATDWKFADYTAKKQGAPRWAAEIYEAYNRELDLCEWWIENRQAPDGSLGGGWGDDVEILRSLGAFSCVSPDASPMTLEGVRKVADGAWNSGEVDTDAGYFAEVGDTEHSGEWTADPLTAMNLLDFGNPVYIERAMKTGKLMRDLWMAVNDKGDFLMRSNLLGATGIGGEGTHNDSRINYRPTTPARAVLAYNNSPTLQKLFVQWADAWLAAALSTGKGKPPGVFPEDIGFDHSEPGGTNSPTWYLGDHPPGTWNSDWEGSGGYHQALVDLMLLAYEATHDKKYLEPLEAEAAFVRAHLPKDFETAKGDKSLVDYLMTLKAGSDAWIAAYMADWPKAWEKTQRVMFPERFPKGEELQSLDQVAKDADLENRGARARWPHVTTENIATDRIAWPDMGNALRAMTGWELTGRPEPIVTYRGLGREFAASARVLDASNLKVLLYNISADPKDAAIVPWLLTVGAEYSFKVGPDADNDGKMDKAVVEQKVKLLNRGQDIPFKLPSRASYVVEMTKIADMGEQALRPDLALSERDIRFRPEFRLVDVGIHNLGSAGAKNVVVRLFDGDRQIGEQTIPNIEPPLCLDAQVVRLSFRFEPKSETSRLSATIDPDNTIQEITEINNKAKASIKTVPAATELKSQG